MHWCILFIKHWDWLWFRKWKVLELMVIKSVLDNNGLDVGYWNFVIDVDWSYCLEGCHWIFRDDDWIRDRKAKIANNDRTIVNWGIFQMVSLKDVIGEIFACWRQDGWEKKEVFGWWKWMKTLSSLHCMW